MPLELFCIFRSCRNLWGFDLLVVSGGGQLDDYGGGAWSHPYTLADSILWLLGQGCDIVLFPSETGSNRVAINDLRAMLAERGITEADRRISTTEPRTVKELLHHMSQMDVVVASRFHGVLLAHLMRQPVLAVSYHDKIDMLMKEMGHARYCLNIRTFTDGEVQKAFTRLRAEPPAGRDRIARKTKEYRDALERQYDTVFG